MFGKLLSFGHGSRPPAHALITLSAPCRTIAADKLLYLPLLRITMHKLARCLRPLITPICFLVIHAQTLPKQLSIAVVQGDNAVSRAGQRLTQDPAVRVTDENQQPVEGVAVVFILPTEGATGVFGNGSKTLATVTNAQGTAAARGIRLNGLPGKVPIQVNVSYRGLTNRTTITEISELAPGAKPSARSGGGHGGVIAVLIILGGAAAAGGGYLATHKTSSPAAAPPPTGPNPIGITPGTGTITGGH